MIDWVSGSVELSEIENESGDAGVYDDVVLTNTTDREPITLTDLSIDAGGSADLTITTGSGAQTTHSLDAPDYMDDGAVVRL